MLNLRLFHSSLNPRNHFSTVLIKTNWYTTSCKYYGCNGLTSIVSNAVVPPALGTAVFSNPNNCNVTVPCGSLEAYMASSWYNYFPNRIEEDCSSTLQEVESTR